MNPRSILIAGLWLMALGAIVLIASKAVGVTANKAQAAV